MKKTLITKFLCQLKNLSSAKHLFFNVNYNKTNEFLASFLTKQGFFRGFFIVNNEKVKICIILKYIENERCSVSFLKKSDILLKKSQFQKHKRLKMYCNGLGLVLLHSIRGFILSENAFWLKLGGKKLMQLV
uniref:Ribosomal protein S8 n=1 Tax=Rhodomonas salina TaxID=3034 RepID=Q9G8U8_RHDSA|nr:ribosomal protein S8 [Rhodomonas salina]AAG17749.1 ribosomal protein S8 [Rhodomonas salina]